MPAIAKETAEPAQLCSALRSEDSCWAQSRDSPEVPEGNSWAKDTKSHPRNLFALNGPLGFTLSSTSFASLHQQGKETAASPFPLERFPAEGCSPTPRLGRTATPAPLPGDGASTACPEPARLLAIHSGREEPAPGPASAAAPSLPPSTGRQPDHGSSGTGAGGERGLGGGMRGSEQPSASRMCVCVSPALGCRRRRLCPAPGGSSEPGDGLGTPGAPLRLTRGAATLRRSWLGTGRRRAPRGARPGGDQGEPCGGHGSSPPARGGTRVAERCERAAGPERLPHPLRLQRLAAGPAGPFPTPCQRDGSRGDRLPLAGALRGGGGTTAAALRSHLSTLRVAR